MSRLLGWLVAGQIGLFTRFVVASATFAVAALALRRLSPAVRSWGLVVASLCLIAALATPAVAALMVLYALAFFWVVEHAPSGRVRGALVVGLLVLQIVAPIWWLPLLPGYAAPVRMFVAFATNMTLLRFWGYAYDRLWRPAPDPPALQDYALFMSFFPAFMNGPLVSLDDFRRRRLAAYWQAAPGPGTVLRAEAGALGRIALGMGLAALAYVSLCDLPHGYAAAARGRPAVAWAHAFRTYACWYVSFSGWTEAAIGFGRLAGIALPENFNAPHLAYSPADFWRRWNMSLQVWLRNYVYLPLGGLYLRGAGGVRHPEWRNTIAVFAVMTAYHLLGALKLLGPGMLVGLWWVPWTLWGAMNAVGVLATRRFTARPRPGIPAAAVVVLTFVFACVGFMTAPFPPGMPLADLAVIYRKLFLLR